MFKPKCTNNNSKLQLIVNNLSNTKIIILLIMLLTFGPCSMASAPSKQTRSIHTKSSKKVSPTLHQHKFKRHRHQPLLTKKKSVHAGKILPAYPLNKKPPTTTQFNFISSFKESFIQFVSNTISTLQYNSYKLGGTRFDASHGIYILDCSSYVDRILQTIYPQAYSNLVSTTGSEKPTTYDYYDFFTNLSDETVYYWDKINTIEQLQAGDIIVFRYRSNMRNGAGGHVMVVMDKPTLNRRADAYYLRVTDAAPSGHSKDTRPTQTSGIGIGTLVLKVNPKTYQPYAYAWKIGSRWKYNVNFAMGRPKSIFNQTTSEA